MIKVAMVTNHFGITGISTVILNYSRMLDHEKYDLTVIAGKPIAEENKNVCDLSQIKLIALPSRHKEPIKHYLYLWRALNRNRYDVVHVHGGSSIMAIELTIAKLSGSKIRIAHSHNSYSNNEKLQKVFSPYFKRTYTKALSCGTLAGNWLFGTGQFEVLPNGLCTENFIFDYQGREKIRRELHAENKYIIGHVGRFNKQKNQPYLLKVFENIAEKRKDAMLLLIGDGPDFEETKALINQHPYKEQIVLYGTTKNPQVMYSAMDIFVLPSRYEGFPIVMLEAQISGLPCVVSDKVTKEIDLGNIYWGSIDDEPKIFAEKILGVNVLNCYERREFYNNHKEQISKFDIRSTVRQLESIYTDLLKGI